MLVATVSTDGSCLTSQNEGRGPFGWAWAIHLNTTEIIKLSKQNNFVSFASGGGEDGTNQVGELMALHEALKYFAPHTGHSVKNLTIESDSKYVIDSFEKWIVGWKKNGWKNSSKKLISNYELIRAIDDEITKRKNADGTLSFVWIKGHSGNEYNEKVDLLARNEALKYKQIIQN